ncbi:GINS complex subunit Psf2 [Schizosaccharomyces japonicus yFS275]|uniref:DNA replication complex GINS protein PSF2 n=1 Tax=Schizosaccharomyces japonicus (strain yFS275 / FY16936) TaxID=402676 RepID=B6JWC2_SCHJY|nr:GINS complex subunit Psf2 [Schizosaccharomyces japonicus yFS275]EEB05673.1 GINS complex subunit Psf2 [Schizosaccharomyces japonicus yFS275]
MSSATALCCTLSPEEIEFLAENMKIEIVPLETMDQLPLISCTIPVMKPPRKLKIPLWLALKLKTQGRARIVPPEWLNVATLEQLRNEEIEQDAFAPLPFHWLEVAQMLLRDCADDMEDVEQIQRLLLELREARQNKARKGLEAVNEVQLGVDNLGAMEINEIRPFFTQIMNRMQKVVQASKEGE